MIPGAWLTGPGAADVPEGLCICLACSDSSPYTAHDAAPHHVSNAHRGPGASALPCCPTSDRGAVKEQGMGRGWLFLASPLPSPLHPCGSRTRLCHGRFPAPPQCVSAHWGRYRPCLHCLMRCLSELRLVPGSPGLSLLLLACAQCCGHEYLSVSERLPCRRALQRLTTPQSSGHMCSLQGYNTACS